MPFFDFHCHPGLKPQFAFQQTKPSPWEFIETKLTLLPEIEIGINLFFNEILNSQSTLSDMINNDLKLIGLVLHAPEQRIAQALNQKKIISQGKVELIDKDRIEYLASHNHPFTLINEELEWLNKARSAIPGQVLTIIDKADEFDENKADTVFAVILVEGLHCFFGDITELDTKPVYLDNFNKFTDAHKVLAINVCHMQQNSFCNHAFGIQFFSDDAFFPSGDGITEWGKEMIALMNQKRILADIKHMSLKARWQLYTMYREGGNGYTQPIICTHAGLTGLSINDRVKYLLKKPTDMGRNYQLVYLKPAGKHVPGAYHNCSSLNLYDEDIENILLSGGIIGISFDQRILGFANENVLLQVTDPQDVEYISKSEAEFFMGPNPSILPVWPDNTNVWASEDFENLDPSLYAETHRKLLVNSLLHILWVANKNPKIDVVKAAKQVCVGSDFDGLINAIDCCKTINDISDLKSAMMPDLEKGLKNLGLSSTINANDLAEDFFYNNGKNFFLKSLS